MITAYTGLPGSGKTYTMANDCIYAMKRFKRPVYANFALQGAFYFTDLSEVLNVERGIIAIDEMNTLAPSAKWQQLPISYMNLWTQSRKNGVDLYYSSQNFKRVVSSIRDVTNYVWVFGWLFGPPSENKDRRGWFDKWHTAKKFEAYDAEKERIRAKPLKKYTFHEKTKIYKYYDTSFRIKPPQHLMEEFDLNLDPEQLPRFDNNLQLI